MGAAVSTDLENIWDFPEGGAAAASAWATEDSVRGSETPSSRGGKESARESQKVVDRSPASNHSQSHSHSHRHSRNRAVGEEEKAQKLEKTPSPSKETTGRISSDATKEAGLSPTKDKEMVRSRSHRSAPSNNTHVETTTAEMQVESQVKNVELKPAGGLVYRDMLFSAMFFIHMTAMVGGIFYMTIVLFKDWDQSKLNRIRRWYPKLVTAVFLGSFFGCGWEFLFHIVRNAKVMAMVVLWSSPSLTIFAAFMLISTGLGSSLGIGIFWLFLAIGQSIYACWVTRRLDYTGEMLAVTIRLGEQALKNVWSRYLVVMAAASWSIIWIWGIVCSLSFSAAPLIILAFLMSFTWTMEILRNVLQAAVGRAVAPLHDKLPQNSVKGSLHKVCTTSFGSICLGSLIVPILHTLRLTARGINLIQGTNEFCFSCAECFLHVMESFIRYGNNWAFVQVGLYGKTFVRSAQDTWDSFKAHKMEDLINKDLTSSLCVLSAITGGMTCVIVCGGWTFGTHKTLTASISILSFFIGYFMVRISMALVQGPVSTYYVCYAENPQRPIFSDSPINLKLKDLSKEIP